MYDNLLRKDTRTPDVTIVPDLAHSWSANDNLDTYTFKLREGVQFHNGAEMTSEDVKRTLERVIFPDTFETTGLRSAYQAIFQTAKVTEINTPDKYTVDIVMAEPRSVGWVMAGASEQGVKISQASVLNEYDGKSEGRRPDRGFRHRPVHYHGENGRLCNPGGQPQLLESERAVYRQDTAHMAPTYDAADHGGAGGEPG